MRKIVLLFFLIAIAVSSYTLSAQVPVNDKYKNAQLKSTVYMQWKFKPKWYYDLFHRRYKKKYGKNMNQVVPMVAATDVDLDDTKVEEEKANIIYENERNKYLDRTIDYEYLLTNKTRDDLYNSIDGYLDLYIKNGGEQEHATIVKNEKDRVKANIEIIHDSHMSNSKKREAYIAFEGDLQKINSLAMRLYNLTKINNLNNNLKIVVE